MSQNCATVQEMAIHLSQQISNVFGAAYCRVALFPSALRLDNVNDTAQEIVTVPISRLSEAQSAQNLNGGSAPREPKLAEPFTPEAETLTRITSACHRPQPRLRFAWQNNEAHGEQGCLDVFFNAPRQISATEVGTLLLMAEVARVLLIFTRMAAVQASSAEQVVRKLQGDVFAMPFLEAKKHWIDAFEHEYLRQQMVKFFGNISKAARAARISRYTLYALLNKFQFSAQSFKRMKPQKASLNRSAAQNGRKKSEEQEVIRDIFAQFS